MTYKKSINGCLICEGTSYSKNIGDYIQSIAQEQFWNKIDCYCEREALNEINNQKSINLIMNGWFMWNPKNFPPSKCINPLFVSFHIVPSFAETFFTPECIAYLKKYEPIGARDMGTKDLLEAHGIKSYYSSCLTLTLGLKYHNEKKSDEILFVDPYYKTSGTRENLLNIGLYFKSVYLLIKYGKRIRPLLDNFQPEYRTIYGIVSKKLEKLICACHFYADYKNSFTDNLLLHSSVITHNVLRKEFPTPEKMMDYARLLVKRYARAKMVVTSRIHCALPCLAVETPVIYVQSRALENIQMRSPGRMKGIVDLFNVIEYTNIVCTKQKEKINTDSNIRNKSNYIKYRDQLITCVEEFKRKIDNTDNEC